MPSGVSGRVTEIMQHQRLLQVVSLCTSNHTEISLVSDFASSLSFWSLWPALDEHSLHSKAVHQLESEAAAWRGPFQPQLLPPQPPAQAIAYSPSTTYAAVIVSDGDNMQAGHSPGMT